MKEKTYSFHIEPRDMLFLRDARPMDASDAGLGANWPRPDQIWNAFINAFHQRWPEHQQWEHNHSKRPDENEKSSFRFGALQTVGPFPAVDTTGEIYFPCPQDLSADDDGTLYPMSLVDAANTDMPRPLTKAFASSRLGKAEPCPWISAADYAKYLAGRSFKPQKVELYDAERNIGIAIDAATRTTGEGKFYQAEYLRFRQGVRMAVKASCQIVGKDREPADVFGKIAVEEGVSLVLGGQQGVANLRECHEFSLPKQRIPLDTANGDVLLRWTLLTPAVFPHITASKDKDVPEHPGGWLPSWVSPANGQIMLPNGDSSRLPGEDRKTWRARLSSIPKFNARLVATKIGKPMAFSGWDLQIGGPKPTCLAVPAGSAYVFQCPTNEIAQLAAALSWNGGGGDDIINRRSGTLGEKGFGIGVCSILAMDGACNPQKLN